MPHFHWQTEIQKVHSRRRYKKEEQRSRPKRTRILKIERKPRRITGPRIPRIQRVEQGSYYSHRTELKDWRAQKRRATRRRRTPSSRRSATATDHNHRLHSFFCFLIVSRVFRWSKKLKHRGRTVLLHDSISARYQHLHTFQQLLLKLCFV